MNEQSLTTHEQLDKTDRENAIKGRQMVVDQFRVMISACWSSWPIGWKKSILNVAGFVGNDAKRMTDCHWSEFSEVNQNLISNGVLRNIQITNFVRGAL